MNKDEFISKGEQTEKYMKDLCDILGTKDPVKAINKLIDDKKKNIATLKKLLDRSTFRCKKEVTNLFGQVLFKENEIYTVLNVDEDDGRITLNHILIANEYGDFSLDFVLENFKVETFA